MVAYVGMFWQDNAMKINAFEMLEPLPNSDDLHAIVMVRPWLDAGNVGTKTLSRLEKRLGATEVGRLVKPGTFFDFTRYRPTTRNIDNRRVLKIPNSSISFVGRREEPDLLFLHLLEPHASSEEYIDSVVEVLKTLGVKRYCRIGAMYNAVPHTRPLWVTGSQSGKPLEGVPGVSFTRGSTYQGPTSILNLITEKTEKLGIETMSLMIHLPQYIELEEDHNGISRMLDILCNIYHLPEDLPDKERGRRQYDEISGEVERNPALQALVKRLEIYYDSRDTDSGETFGKDAQLSPEIEQFLEDLGKDIQDKS